MIKRIFTTDYSTGVANAWLLLLRLCIAGFMLTHGIPKLEKLLKGGDIQFADPLGIGATASLALVVFAEVICSALLALGLATRLASLVLIINMSVAAFITHGADPFSKMEKALLYLLVYFTLLVFGAGRYSLDAQISKGGAKKKPAKSKR